MHRPEVHEKGSRQASRVVVAEDDPDIRRLVSTVLARAGHEPEAYCDGRAALDASPAEDAANGNAPALYLLDIQMPGLTGLELCRRLKASPATRSSAVLLMSADDTGVGAAAAVAAGADGFLPKPFGCRDLLRRVSDLIALTCTAGVGAQ